MNQLSVALSSIISLLIIAFLLFWLYRQTMLDVFRQNLFALRDAFFDHALLAGIDFSHPAYTMMRNTINGTIRFGHRFNLPFAILLPLIAQMQNHKQARSFNWRLEKEIASLTSDQKKLVRTYHQQLNALMLRHLVFSSPFLLLTVITPALFMFKAKRHMDAILKALSKPIDRIDSLALVNTEVR